MNLQTVKLGRKAPVHDARTLKMGNYLSASALPVIPAMHNWGTAVPDNGWGVMGNNDLGDCTAAAVGHIILAHTASHGHAVKLPDAEIVHLYSMTGGYVPGDPSTDNGAAEIPVLNYWRNHGIAGHKIFAYVALNPKDVAQIREAIYLFGAVYAGVTLPLSAQDQDPWHVTDRLLQGDASPGSWGGHAIPFLGYDTHAFQTVTWGAAKWMTDDWISAYCDEAYALISPDWVLPDGAAPNRFNFEQLKADLTLL